MFTTISKKAYPNFPAIAKHLGIAVISLTDYENWADIFFVKIAGTGWRFVSKKLFTRGRVKTRKIVKSATEKPRLKQREKLLYRVCKVWDQGSRYYGNRVVSVLTQRVGTGEKPQWDWIFLAEGVKRDDIVERNGTYIVKSQQTYAEAMGLY